LTNFEKLAIASLLEGKLKVNDLDIKDFTGKSPRFLFNLIKKYSDTYGRIPAINSIEATINTQISEDKAKIYIGYLEGLPENIQDDSEYILGGLRTSNNIKLLDSKIESLVELVSERDLDGAREVLKELLETTNDSKNKVADMKDLEFSTDNLLMLDCVIPDVSNKLQGVTLISAKSGSGKSVLSLQQALYSYKQGYDVLYVNLELSQNEAIARILSSELHIPFQDIYKDLDKDEIVYYNQKKDEIFSRDNKFKMINVGLDANKIINIIRAEKETGLDLAVIDYLQIVENDKYEEQWRFLSQFVKDLHRLTLELGLCILTPIQINEVTEKNGTMKVAARGSSELEFSSSLWFHLHQSEDEAKEGLARMFTIKSRHSRKNTYVLQPDFEHMKFNATGLTI